MTTTAPARRRPPRAPAPVAEIREALAAVERGEVEDLGDFSQYAQEVPAELVAALIRVVQATAFGIAGAIGRGDMSPNATLVRLGAAREDVETLRVFLAARPRPSHLPDQED